jgi:uncharacterized repeat protein (TIGR03803 family)
VSSSSTSCSRPSPIPATGLVIGWLGSMALGVLLAACGGGGGSSGSQPHVTYTIGGTVVGLISGSSVTLANSNGDSLAVSTASFVLPTALATGSSFDVTVLVQPPNQTCVASDNAGSVTSANVTNVLITCKTPTFTIGGIVYGLATGGSVVLLNNGADPLTVTSNSSFTFATAIPRLSGYSVSVGTQPQGQTCTVNYASGGGVIQDMNSVIVQCATETVLWSFGSGVDGITPWGGLIEGSDGAFYGTTNAGGTFGQGTVYRITSAGQETVVWNFGSGSDGAGPYGALVVGTDGNFYGTTYSGGTQGFGTVYRLTPSGLETVLWNFGTSANDGQNPRAGLIQATDGNFYGTTMNGGAAGYGTVFTVTAGGAETVLWSFGVTAGDSQNPFAPLLQASDGNFYGTSVYGGASGSGSAFEVTAAGSETMIWSFSVGTIVMEDGFAPDAPLIEGNDGYLYGTTYGGGDTSGTVFRLPLTQGPIVGGPAYETVTYRFGASGPTDGVGPQAALIIGSDGNFYGTTSFGGAYQGGTAFVLTSGGIESVLWNFGSSADAQDIQAPLLQASDGAFYGVSLHGGSSNKGAVFRLSQ